MPGTQSIVIMRKKGLGRDYVADKRDNKYKLAYQSTPRFYRYWNTSWQGDQGATPQCVGYSWAHWLNASPFRQFVKPDGLYRLCQYVDEWEGNDYDGTSVRAGAKVLQSLGFISEYRWTTDIQTLANAILTRGPVVVGTWWYSAMYQPDKDGWLTVSGSREGGHAYLVTGVNTRQHKFKIKNSWGEGWGRNGTAYVMFSDMQRLLSEHGECCLGIEQRPGP